MRPSINAGQVIRFYNMGLFLRSTGVGIGPKNLETFNDCVLLAQYTATYYCNEVPDRDKELINDCAVLWLVNQVENHEKEECFEQTKQE